MLDTLANVKSRLGITDVADNDFLTQQIKLISEVIEGYCRRKFKATNWIQTFYPRETRIYNHIELFHYPIIAVGSVIGDLEYDYSSDVRVHKPTGILTRFRGGTFSPEELIITYRAGYEILPVVIQDVLDTLVQERYNKKKSGVSLNFGSDVQRISIPGAISLDFDYSLSNNERKSSYGSIIGSQANVLDAWASERAVMGSGKLEYLEEDV